MRHYSAGLIAITILLLSGWLPEEQNRTEFIQKSNGTIILEDFSDDKIGELPRYWFNRNAERRTVNFTEETKATYEYRVMEEDGRRFLRYEGSQAKHLNLPLKNVGQVNVRETPVLSWEWRAHVLPEGANEEARGANDTVLSVYVVWGLSRFRIPRVMLYSWSSTLPEGHFFTRNLNQQKVLVVASGEDKLGEWQRFERNIVEDYRKYFGGRPPERPMAILILSCANETESFAKGDYANFRLSAE